MVGLGRLDNTADSAKVVSTLTQAALDLKAPLASPAFTGTVTGISKAMVGLDSVDNTADAAKPVSTAMLTALNAKQSTLVTVESGNICTSLGNKQRLVATTDAKLKVQHYDDDGSIITDSWLDELSLD